LRARPNRGAVWCVRTQSLPLSNRAKEAWRLQRSSNPGPSSQTRVAAVCQFPIKPFVGVGIVGTRGTPRSPPNANVREVRSVAWHGGAPSAVPIHTACSERCTGCVMPPGCAGSSLTAARTPGGVPSLRDVGGVPHTATRRQRSRHSAAATPRSCGSAWTAATACWRARTSWQTRFRSRWGPRCVRPPCGTR
jgi:hypothetical protein